MDSILSTAKDIYFAALVLGILSMPAFLGAWGSTKLICKAAKIKTRKAEYGLMAVIFILLAGATYYALSQLNWQR